MSNTLTVLARSNTGADATVPAFSMKDALSRAKSLRVSGNHMVTVARRGMVVKRWDRDRFLGTNSWKSVDTEEMEVLGPIRTVIRCYSANHPNARFEVRIGDNAGENGSRHVCNAEAALGLAESAMVEENSTVTILEEGAPPRVWTRNTKSRKNEWLLSVRSNA